MTIVLIGPPAAGKSRSGRRLARVIGATFADTDRIIQSEHGPIRELFAERGEAAFRELEREAVRRALETHEVVSLGGGAVMDEQTQRLLVERGAIVILLTVRPDAVAERIANDRRPLITGVDAWRKLADSRRSTYERLATITVDTSFRPMRRVIDELVDRLVELGAIERPLAEPAAEPAAPSEEHE